MRRGLLGGLFWLAMVAATNADTTIEVSSFTDQWVNPYGSLKVTVRVQRWVFVMPYGLVPLGYVSDEPSWVKLGSTEMAVGDPQAGGGGEAEYVYQDESDAQNFGVVAYIVRISCPGRSIESGKRLGSERPVIYQGQPALEHKIYSHPGWVDEWGLVVGDTLNPAAYDLDDDAECEFMEYLTPDGNETIIQLPDGC